LYTTFLDDPCLDTAQHVTRKQLLLHIHTTPFTPRSGPWAWRPRVLTFSGMQAAERRTLVCLVCPWPLNEIRQQLNLSNRPYLAPHRFRLMASQMTIMPRADANAELSRRSTSAHRAFVSFSSPPSQPLPSLPPPPHRPWPSSRTASLCSSHSHAQAHSHVHHD